MPKLIYIDSKLKCRRLSALIVAEQNNNSSLEANRSLRPWIRGEIDPAALKSMHSCKKMLEQKALKDIFKCMASICCFTTDKFSDIERHIDTHSDHPGCLQCAYCTLEASDPIELTSHLTTVHKTDVFQCKYCFYRSCMVSHQYEHLKRHHPNESAGDGYIYLKDGVESPTKEPYEFSDVQRARKTFVQPMACGGKVKKKK